MGSASRVVLILLALLYIVIPYDVVPDFRPVLGWLDDVFILGLLVYYLVWRGRSLGHRGQGGGYSRARGSDKEAAFYAHLGVEPGAGPDRNPDKEEDHA
jgi:hypothetical protein